MNKHMCNFIILILLLVVAYKFFLVVKRVPYGLYVINLERRNDRLENFINQFDKSDLRNQNLIRHKGIDGAKLNMEKILLSGLLSDRARREYDDLIRTKQRKYHHQLSIGAIGCYLSHVQIWETTILKNHAYSIILEDDFPIPINLSEEIDNLLHLIPKDWDIILLHHCLIGSTEKNGYRKVNRFQSLAAYMISKKGAQKIFKSGLVFPMSRQIDAFLSEMSDMRFINIYSSFNSIGPPLDGQDTDIQIALGGTEPFLDYPLI